MKIFGINVLQHENSKLPHLLSSFWGHLHVVINKKRKFTEKIHAGVRI